ncbi:MAG: hypothetical protein ACLUUJ_04045 [Acutalibacteraceae bacterium]
MAENDMISEVNKGGFKEAVCIDAMRIYDTCSAKDCLEDLRVILPVSQIDAVNQATGVRLRKASVLTVYLDLQPVPFDRGFYSVDMTFFFEVELELFGPLQTGVTTVTGLCVFSKKVILFGSEGSVKMFASDKCPDMPDDGCLRNMPKATVQVAEPIALSARLCDQPFMGCDTGCRTRMHLPAFWEEFCGPQQRSVLVTLGVFTIVQIVRNANADPGLRFLHAGKECATNTDNPCDLFRRLFPTDQFFAGCRKLWMPRVTRVKRAGGCELGFAAAGPFCIRYF